MGGAFVLLIVLVLVLVLEFSIIPRRDDDHEYENEIIPHPFLIIPQRPITGKNNGCTTPYRSVYCALFLNRRN